MAVPVDAVPDTSRARVEIMFSARDGVRSSLAAALAEHAAGVVQAELLDPSVAVRVLAGIEDDPFPGLNPGGHPMDVVLELDGPANPLTVEHAVSAVGGLVATLEPLIDARASGAVFGRPQSIIGGSRSALRYLYLMRRRADLSHADYLDHYFHHHSAYAFHLRGIHAYTQVHVDQAASAELARCLNVGLIDLDSVTELSFDSVGEFFAGVTPEAAEASTDEERFVDRDRSISFCMTDHLMRAAR